MATFTPEEIDLLKNRGNEYCKRVWLGLFDGTMPSDRDPQAIRDFMIDKYERKRHYLEPSQALRNGFTSSANVSAAKIVPPTRPISNLVQDVKPLRVNGNAREFATNRKNEEQNKVVDFVADFASADIFSAVNNSNSGSNNNSRASTTHVSFANFDNNPVFSNTSKFSVSFFKYMFICRFWLFIISNGRQINNTLCV